MDRTWLLHIVHAACKWSGGAQRTDRTKPTELYLHSEYVHQSSVDNGHDGGMLVGVELHQWRSLCGISELDA